MIIDTSVDPGVPISREAALVHGITDADVRGKPGVHRVMEELEPLLEQHGLSRPTRALHSHGAEQLPGQGAHRLPPAHDHVRHEDLRRVPDRDEPRHRRARMGQPGPNRTVRRPGSAGGYPPPGERLTGLLAALPSEVNREVEADALAREVLSTSVIEGEILGPDQVRSCVAARLGLDAGKSLRPIPAVEGIVRIMVDATARYREELTEERILGWHSWLFPQGRSGLRRVRAGAWRTGPARVVSGHVGRERVHFEGPEPGRVPGEMSAFLEWFNRPPETDGVLRAGIAHLWFVAVHPLEDGNGPIARAITDMALAQSQNNPMRLNSMSHRILRERDAYCRALENATRGTCDITASLSWFAQCLGRAMDDALRERAGQLPLNHRQLRVLELLIREPEETITTGRWARVNRSTREEAEADTDRMDGMVRAMLLGESPQESVNPTHRLARGG